MELRLNGSIVVQALTMNGTAAQIPTTNLNSRKSMLIRNNGAATIFLGWSNVTTSTGYPLKAGEQLPMAINENCKLYGITAGTDVEIRVMEAI